MLGALAALAVAVSAIADGLNLAARTDPAGRRGRDRVGVGRRAAYVGQYQLELRLGNAAAERIGYGVALAVVLGTHRSHGSGGTG
jgi:hypothetical protein